MALNDTPQIITHASLSVPYTVFDVKWVPRSARVVALGQTPRGRGILASYKLTKKGLEEVSSVTKGSGFKCGSFGGSLLEERHLATGDFGGRVCVWDVEHPEVPVYMAAGHEGIVNALDGVGGVVGEGAPELVTGGRDGAVHVWDVRQKGEPVLSFVGEKGGEGRDAWAVAFGNAYSPEERSVAAGYDNGDVKLFDLRTSSVLWETNVANGVAGLSFDRPDIEMNKLHVSTLEGKVRVYDLRTFNQDHGGYAYVQHDGHDATAWRSTPLPQNRDVFMSSYGDGSLSLFSYGYPEKRSEKDPKGNPVGVAGQIRPHASLAASSQPIHCFDWSPDKRGLCVFGSFDQCIRVGLVTKLELL